MFGVGGFGKLNAEPRSNPWIRKQPVPVPVTYVTVPVPVPPRSVVKVSVAPPPAPIVQRGVKRGREEPVDRLGERFAPTDLWGLLGQDVVVGAIRDAIEKRKMNAVLLWGPSGCGKSAFVRAYAAVTGRVLLDLTPELLTEADYGGPREEASEGKRRKVTDRLLAQALGAAWMDGKERLVLVDDGDALPASVWPRLLTGLTSIRPGRLLMVVVNDLYSDNGLAGLREAFRGRMFRFKALGTGLIEGALRGAATTLGRPDVDCRALAIGAGGDLRRAFHLLGFLLLDESGLGRDSLPEPSPSRLTAFDLFQLAGRSGTSEALSLLVHDVRVMSAFVAHNAVRLSDRIDMAARAADNVALADRFFRFGKVTVMGPEIGAAPLLAALRTVPDGGLSRAEFPAALLRKPVKGEARPLLGAKRRSSPASRALAACW